jgi:hypothetical protein
MKIKIDPPNGWRYGFPKEYDPYRDPPIREWLVSQGYPQSEIDQAGAGFVVRTIDNNDGEFIPGLPTSI